MRHWRIVMLPWLVTFHVTRLGFEAQNAAAFRFLRLVGNASRIKADEIISDTIAPPLDSPPAAIKVAPKGRLSMSKVYKKPTRANKRKKAL
jgi:hypothetical protein